VSQPLPPSVARISAIAKALCDLSAEVVFIGGAIAPLLQTEQVIPRVRPTKDVDAVIASTSYSEYGGLREKLIRLNFKEAGSDNAHVHKWTAPDGTPFDLVPAGSHLGGTGSEWDRIALETSVDAILEPGVKIRHASAPGFLALKWAAFSDRGKDDPFASHDLEDILALTVSRKSIVGELRIAPSAVREHVREGFRWLLENEQYEDLIAGHLSNAQAFKLVAATLRERIREIVNG
jgi:predicted nucleotidyltransferase